MSDLDGYVLDFQQIGNEQAPLVGGKGTQLAELSRIDGIQVPAGYVVTTRAFRRVLAAAPVGDRLHRLSGLRPDDRSAIGGLSAEIRDVIAETPVPDALAAAITRPLAELGEQAGYAVRSSATAEDLPSASFAGQQDSYLNVVGPAAVLAHVRRCWASLFTERAVTYRIRNGFDHRGVQMAVVVQRMVPADASGVLFTADPVTSNRRISSVEASFGLGEALVSGLVNADVYRARDGRLVDRVIGAKQLVVRAASAGGTRERPTEAEQRRLPALTDAQVLRLVELGRRIEEHFGCPQDIEWCLLDDQFRFVQSRPITTLFPIPESGDEANHVYLSVGHQQMMTDPIRPLGLSIWQLTTPAPMAEAGGRLFVDVTERLASQEDRDALLAGFAVGDPLTGDALRTVLDRGDLVPIRPEQDAGGSSPEGAPPAVESGTGATQGPLEPDPEIVEELIARTRASVDAVTRDIEQYHGPALFDFILRDLEELRRILFDPRSHQVVMAAVDAVSWLEEKLGTWLGEESATDTLTQSVPHNVTSQMGLALLDVADAIRPHPAVVDFLRNVQGEEFLDELIGIPGGVQARDALLSFLDEYGMRCVGEIDITRPRWTERPGTLLPALLGNIDNFEPGAGPRRFEQGRKEAEQKRAEVLTRLRELPDGDRKAAETASMIDRLRTFIGYREYPKYGMISRYFVYRRALLREVEILVRDGVLGAPEDAFFLRFQELREVVRTGQADDQLIRRRRAEFDTFRALTPPRVLTSEGESVAGTYRGKGGPPGALVGLPVSAGYVDGRARVVRDLGDADLEVGDILVTAYTDPSWSPVFVTIAGLVTEVGGTMTHGAVVAREYGLPAVVGVQRATQLIRDGQRIRVDGTNGHVEILS